MLKLVARHLDLGKSLFRTVSVDWSTFRQLSLDAGKKSPSELLSRAADELTRRTNRALENANLWYADDRPHDTEIHDDLHPLAMARARENNSKCRVAICMCLHWHRTHRQAAAYVVTEESITQGLCSFFNRNTGLMTAGVLFRILLFFNAAVAPKDSDFFCGMVFVDGEGKDRHIHGRIEEKNKIDPEAYPMGVVVTECQRRAHGDLELLLHRRVGLQEVDFIHVPNP